MDYQKTLNLPKTNFSMRAGLINKEPAFLEKWNTEQLYQQIRQQSKGKPSFILHDGPPYANGHIHIGHALNKILKDIIVRQKTMSGYDALYVPGWDCHGLPIEHKLLKEMKAKKEDVEVLAFRQQAHDYAMKYVSIQADEFKRLGIFGEWHDPYLTLNPEYEYWIIKTLGDLVRQGYVYRSLKPVNWCFDCETALAEAEVEYEDHTSPTVFVRFPVLNPEVLGVDMPSNKLNLLVWTTTPWTLLANVAVSVNAKLTYVLVDTGDDVLVMEKSLSTRILEKGGVSSYKILKEVSGTELTSLTYSHVFDKKESCPVVTADYVTAEDGTGLVHTAPGHGQDDYQTGLKNKLDILMPVNGRGVFKEEGSPFTGQHVFKANPQILDDLKKRGLLFAHEQIEHSYPHCWRCKKPIIFRATQQWFVNINHNGLRERLKESIDRDVKWFPSSGKERISSMVSTRPDWCLSRQRHWGVPIPAVRFKGRDEEYLYPEVVDHVAMLAKKHGSNVWFEWDIQDLLPQGFEPSDGDKADLEKAGDILDVWFDSGVSHRAVFHSMIDKPLPADLYLEGSDQHRGWFQSSLIPSVALDGKAPYKQVLTHGFVVDGQGRKMSKSLGNVIAPNDIMKQNGADILRLWVASSNYHDDIRLSKEITARLIDGYRKIRNTLRYMLGNVHEFNPDQDSLHYDDLLKIDQWALNRLARLITNVTEAYEVYDFAKIYRTIFAFCNETMSGIYLDILKDRLYTSGAQSRDRRSAQTVLYLVLDALVRLLAPVLVFTAEEVFDHMPKTAAMRGLSSVHLLDWPNVDAQWASEDIEKHFDLLLQLRPFVLKKLEDARREEVIGASLDAKVILKTSSDRDAAYFGAMLDDLPSMFIASQVELDVDSAVTTGISDAFAKTHIDIVKADGDKCPRCWNYRTDIGFDSDHPTVCARCAEAVKNSNVAT